MSEVNLKIFKDSYVSELLQNLRHGDGLATYHKQEFECSDDSLLVSNVLVAENAPTLSASADSDFENSIKVFEYLPMLDRTQSSDPRLWAYLSHVTFRDYTFERWGPKSELDNEDKNKSEIDRIEERWFVLNSSARLLRRNSISRLWWATFLTDSPWVKNPEYFGELETTDRFTYTKILFSKQDIAQQVLERKLSWSNPVLIALLEYIRTNAAFENRESYRALLREVNLMLGFRNIEALNFKSLLSAIDEAAQAVDV